MIGHVLVLVAVGYLVFDVFVLEPRRYRRSPDWEEWERVPRGIAPAARHEGLGPAILRRSHSPVHVDGVIEASAAKALAEIARGHVA